MKFQFSEIKGERVRTYIFPGDVHFVVEHVARIHVRPSGSHRLETRSGVKYIVPAKWVAIRIEADDWSL